ncbi:hypothetical protein CBR_g22477 [Chara braunii]|uniref:Reverse transcriptase domain-containing protein n=1 Tax=Chara braunii TaxID=69332 RepID=A0A388L2W6_CHABU|nr:hypothetical protein CBR_g22477 [Chara braunii]|eukprot:GBG76598.1 hypothetical protein CBR_g22477 [Chara braunii]
MINFCVIVYMDDILVYSKTYHGHAQHIEWTLGALRDAGFKIALEKNDFFLSEISFLGYVVTRGGLRPDSRNVAAVKEAPVPTSLTQVRSFLGLASYYRRFIKGFAAIARPLMNLLWKDQPLSCDTECQQAFATLKDALAMAPILIRPDPLKQFILITDWQPEAISAILARKGNDGCEHVIEYASRTVPDERRNDSAPQGECYAVVWGIQHFHPYLYGQKLRLVTDHEPLLALKKLTNYTGMIGRWAVRLQEYDFDIVHRKKERHGNEDGLTRLHWPAKFFCTAGVCGAEEFRFTSDPQVVVLAEAMTFQRRAAPGISHVSTVVVFSGDITAFDPARQAAIKSTLYRWGRDLAIDWDRRLTTHEFVELSFCLLRVDLNWTWEGDQRPASEIVELLVIQAWRTNVVGDLLGFIFGAVDRGNRLQIVRELTIVIARLADELPLDIVSQSDKEPVPHTLSRTLAPSLQWSSCIEERWVDDRFPSRSKYLDVHSLTNPRFFRQPTTSEWAAPRAEEEAEEESEGELRRETGEAAARLAEDEEEEREAEEESAEEKEEEEDAEEETLEEEKEAYSEYSEGEQSEEEEDDEEVESEDNQEPTHDELEWVPGSDRREENPEAAAQRKKEIAEGKRLGIDPAPNDSFKDPEPPKPEHGDLAATTLGAATTRRRSRSRSTSPSASPRPPIRQRVNEGLSPSSPIHISPSPYLSVFQSVFPSHRLPP